MAMVSATRAAKAVIKLSLRNRGMAFIVIDGGVKTIRRGPTNCYRIIHGIHDYEVAIKLLSCGRYSYRDAVKHRFDLEQIAHAFNTAFDKTTDTTKVHIVQD